MKNQTTQLGPERFGVHAVGLAASRMNIIFRELPTSDRGIDGQFELTDESGCGNGRLIALQIKAGESYLKESSRKTITFRFDDKHKSYWLEHSVPVMVIVCDPEDQECYWEIVTHNTCKPTGKNWKIDIPKKNTLRDVRPLIDVASPIMGTEAFTVMKEDDNSHALARRISLDIVLNPIEKSWSNILVASVIRNCVKKGRNSDYYRNEQTRSRYLGKPADMVSGFVYTDQESFNSAQWVCKFQWTSSQIHELARFEGVQGELDSNGLVIEWSVNRNLVPILKENRIGKGEFVKKLDKQMSNFGEIVSRLEEFNSGEFSFEKGGNLAKLCEKFELSWVDNFTAPVECETLNQKTVELVGLVGNLVHILGEKSTYSRHGAAVLVKNHEVYIREKFGEIKVHRKDIK